jgi:transcriptional regulator with XRE-family HTH domain
MQESHPLETYRKQHSMTKAALARLLSVSKTTITRWERGIRKIDEDLVPSIASTTGIPAKELRPDAVEKHEAIYGATQ